MSIENIILVVGGILTGLLAGLFYTFEVAVVPALRRLKAAHHITAMQLINVKILNPAFFLTFFGPTILLPLAAFMHRGGPQFLPLLAAALLHIIGVNGITIVGNVPLNDRLAELDVAQLSDTEAERARDDYHGSGARWMRLHTLRTAAGILATGLVFIASMMKDVSK